ncbi:MAG: DUF4835 domain-containing protein [Flavobacteriales bacterium CG_4_9_14_0_2_um_filter_32_27]|nr:MAG: DUF4835 domain-containing protein [Flavobacteriales bacterium CG_4_9_14_0_2_um_filter_32_27]
MEQLLLLIKKISFLILLLMGSIFSFAQELNCTVQINSSQVQATDKSVFDVMQKNIFEFMNSKKWTNNIYQPNERIECSMLISVNEQSSPTTFKASIQIQSRRPIFNSSYNSTLLNHIDKEFEFTFNEFDNLQYSETSFLNNLTSVLAFYAYVVIGLDYDSYSLKGGTPYFTEAQKIISNAQGAKEPGWKAFESNANRYWIIQDLLHPTHEPLRQCYYEYHRLGFDVMAKDVAAGRVVVLESLKLLDKVYKAKPGAFQLQSFFNAKADEIVNLFKDALVNEKNEVVTLLDRINSMNASKYKAIKK